LDKDYFIDLHKNPLDMNKGIALALKK